MYQHIIHFCQQLWGNTPLVAAFAAIGLTQVLKIPIHYFQYGNWDFHKVIDAGGLPSSHAAGACALTTALAFVVGPGSPEFATAVVFTAIVMYDAGGIRRHAGEHATLLNRISLEIQRSGTAIQTPSTTFSEGERLKEILGHEPREVVIGAIIGILVGAALGHWW